MTSQFLFLSLFGSAWGLNSTVTIASQSVQKQASDYQVNVVVPSQGYPMDKLRFNGRWWNVNGGMATGWGQSFVAKFKGSSTVRVSLDGGGMYYTYRIDGGAWRKVGPTSRAFLVLAMGLSRNSEHTVEFGRSDEGSYGVTTIYDLELDAGYTALTPDAPKVIYEAIGDSITAGFKVDCHPGGGTPTEANEDQYETYVAHLAEAWGTDDWHVVARSGIGVGPVAQPLAGTILQQYNCRAYSELAEGMGVPCLGAEKWDFAKERQPNVITVNLGTNDYAFGNPSLDTFQSNYKKFVSFVRSVHPNATIFCICPLQYSLSSPCSTCPVGRDKKWEKMMKGVKGAVEAIGDPKIVYIPMGTPEDPPMDGATEFSDWTHPTVEGHAHFAKLLEKVLTPIVRRNHFTELARVELV